MEGKMSQKKNFVKGIIVENPDWYGIIILNRFNWF